MGATAAQKMEARRLQLLIKQRERLEADVRALDEEIMLLVCPQVLVVARHLTYSSGSKEY
jgi:hypothetical protein